MRNTLNCLLTVTVCLMVTFTSSVGWADEPIVPEGKKIAFDRKLGNCLACHKIADGESPGDVGPALSAIQSRFPDREALRLQIADPRINHPDSRMPPFGPHGILTPAQIELVVDYIATL